MDLFGGNSLVPWSVLRFHDSASYGVLGFLGVVVGSKAYGCGSLGRIERLASLLSRWFSCFKSE